MTEVAVSVESLPLGHTVARIATRPLIPPGPSACPCGACGHTPETTDGFDVIDFSATVLRMPLDPWEQYTVIHGLELLPDGRPRNPRRVFPGRHARRRRKRLRPLRPAPAG